jgi:hypothetical protein
VIATRAIVADAAPLLALISDSASQWRIVENVSPLLQPSANVQPSRAPGPVYVRVRFGSRDVLWITWILTARRGTTEVDLAAQVESRSIFARLLLAFGGRLWLRRRLEQTLSTLAMLAHRAAQDLDDIERDADMPPRPLATSAHDPRTALTGATVTIAPKAHSETRGGRIRASVAKAIVPAPTRR